MPRSASFPGILGDDYYDKLMTLKALSSVFPDTVFFTTDLDAAMLLPGDNRFTRNLIVASGTLSALLVNDTVCLMLTPLVVAVMALGADCRRACLQAQSSGPVLLLRAQARRVSGLAGQRDESLHALREARRFFPDKTALREEVIACLALMDLKRETNTMSLGEQTGLSELNPDRGVLAAAGTDGMISVRGLADGQTRKTLAGSDRAHCGNDRTSEKEEGQMTAWLTAASTIREDEGVGEIKVFAVYGEEGLAVYCPRAPPSAPPCRWSLQLPIRCYM